MIDANDDLAIARAPFKVVAVIPVHGRLPLLPFTIRRLYDKNGISKVICVGDGVHEKQVCEQSGALWVQHQNKPLGKKWNAGFLAAKELNPDAILYAGSSDWLSDNWLTIMQPYLNLHQMVGVPGMNLVDIAHRLRAVEWSGYDRRFRDETIGIGRVLSRNLLNKIQWQPFNDLKDNSLDRSMADKAKSVGVPDYFVIDNRIKALSISSPFWNDDEQNKHKFDDHWNSKIHGTNTKITNPEQWCAEHFPEALELHKVLTGVTV